MPEAISNQLDAVLDRQRTLWMNGGRPTVEELLSVSDFDHDSEAHLDLVYNEVVIREDLGESPSAEEYIERYPHLAQDLSVHFEIHRAVNDQLLIDTDDTNGVDSWSDHDMTAAVSPPVLADYDILQPLGQGGMGVVYKARHRKLHRAVAIKMFHPHRWPTPREVSRFQSEAEAIARLTHPNIVQIFEIGQCDGLPFLALELAERGTLAQKLQLLPYTPKGAASLIETLARAVHHAHEHQVIHRDLKPANVLFANEGTPKITDFGLAKVIYDDELPHDATQSGEPLGTPRYMSPEQAAGQRHLICPATDVYGLGTLLYECLTGKAPFVAATVVETLQKIRGDEPLNPQRLQPSIPRDLATICLHCLQKHPSRRYQTALALAEDLSRFQNGKPILARPISIPERLWKWSKRRPTHAALIAVALFAAISFFAIAAVGRHRETKRLAELSNTITELVNEGRAALEADDVDLAYGRFHEAWIKVQGEPALVDHQVGVSGWLDHSRHAQSQQQWKQRVPPREFDEKRDEALMLSLFLDPRPEQPTAVAREAIQAALELTLANDPAWIHQREFLTLVEADVIAHEAAGDKAIEFLNATGFSSRVFHERRAALLTRAGRFDEAAIAKLKAQEFAPNIVATRLFSGMDHVRSRDFSSAIDDFNEVLNREPEHFNARLFQACCLLKLHRAAEAKVALTACTAQRPRFAWGHYFRGIACQQIGELKVAARDFQRSLDQNLPEPTRSVASDAVRRLLSTEVPSESFDQSEK